MTRPERAVTVLSQARRPQTDWPAVPNRAELHPLVHGTTDNQWMEAGDPPVHRVISDLEPAWLLGVKPSSYATRPGDLYG